MLSRSYTISRPSEPRQIKWSPSLGYTESYDSGIPGAVLRRLSRLFFPVRLFFRLGLSPDRHLWKHDQIGIDYHGAAG